MVPAGSRQRDGAMVVGDGLAGPRAHTDSALDAVAGTWVSATVPQPMPTSTMPIDLAVFLTPCLVVTPPAATAHLPHLPPHARCITSTTWHAVAAAIHVGGLLLCWLALSGMDDARVEGRWIWRDRGASPRRARRGQTEAPPAVAGAPAEAAAPTRLASTRQPAAGPRTRASGIASGTSRASSRRSRSCSYSPYGLDLVLCAVIS